MKRRSIFILSFLLCAFVLLVFKTSAEAAALEEEFYYVEGSDTKGYDFGSQKNLFKGRWEQITSLNGKKHWCLLDIKKKSYVTGFVISKTNAHNGIRDAYYLKNDYTLATNCFIKIDNLPHYVCASSSGRLIQGWKKSNGYWFYFDKNYTSVSGWKTIGGKTYYFRERVTNELRNVEVGTCALVTGHGKYLDSRCFSTSDINRIKEGEAYCFKADGTLKKGWIELDGSSAISIHYVGKTGWVFIQQNNRLKTGWFKNGGKWYYFEPDKEKASYGVALCSTNRVINGKRYYFTSDCVCRNP